MNNRKVRQNMRMMISNYTAWGANIGKSDVLYVLCNTASVFLHSRISVRAGNFCKQIYLHLTDRKIYHPFSESLALR
jgi:hypothetical protein